MRTLIQQRFFNKRILKLTSILFIISFIIGLQLFYHPEHIKKYANVINVKSSNSNDDKASLRMKDIRDIKMSDKFDEYKLEFEKYPNVVEYINRNSGSLFDEPKACFVVLVKNSEIDDMSRSLVSYQEKFNHQYKYPWVFLNDEDFTQEFKERISNILDKDQTRYKFGKIDKKRSWSYPEWINEEEMINNREKMRSSFYGDGEISRHLSRFFSGFFWRHEILDEFDWYWRIEPRTKLTCDIKYDIFEYMQQNHKYYGFTMSVKEYEPTVNGLWETIEEFSNKNPDIVNNKNTKDNLFEFITYEDKDTKKINYNLCQFWSNFEIGNLNFYRSPQYRYFFDYIDQIGKGIYYERWSDATIHTIGLTLFLRKTHIKLFEDIGYSHSPFTHCPLDDKIFKDNKCSCSQEADFTFQEPLSCGKLWYKVNDMKIPFEFNRRRHKDGGAQDDDNKLIYK